MITLVLLYSRFVSRVMFDRLGLVVVNRRLLVLVLGLPTRFKNWLFFYTSFCRLKSWLRGFTFLGWLLLVAVVSLAAACHRLVVHAD